METKTIYPIKISHIKRLIKNCEEWKYGNKDTCKYVAECLIDYISTDYPNLPIKNSLYNDIIEIVHDINNGSLIKKIEIEF
jgi:hypothetical protein